MGRAGLGVGLAMAAVLVGGCGATASRESGSAATTPAGSTAGSATSPPQQIGGGGDDAGTAPDGPLFPLMLRRTGGIAGFDDRIVLEASGRLHVETRSVHGRVCTLEPRLQHQLLSLLATLRLGSGAVVATDVPTDSATPVGGEATESDPITISVTDDHARAVDLTDPSLGEIAGLVGTLVSDVTLSTPATTRCTTPTTSAR